ncbi:Poly-beta-1,6-N-acetyl-D-glucosamine synthase [Anaerococcus prevotii]|uniref:Glycosyl transferase family 2 n=1 Tax=Anaerococcus prevotii (strain ATCC 9321 / DSM 20548 / JCM 6508 / NCTC 11806 / PC1) TaxID=525919 RepID=C7RFN6_ANAPD|nr:glycosyltransferase [Anaerococcus prevotii]ACV28297.1 glycosyl transferase family 2 [Anaerococcus prevotii DSM 20548]SUU93851.1 Poly-beta-1,6-N-acetyl-D-glucosamine synthase [Anaerococcus prevotii]
MKIIFWVSAFAIFYPMIGYPLTLLLLDKIIKRKNIKDYTYKPKVSVIISAYNEEKVIEKKLNNIIKTDYPDFEVIIANDASNDRTVELSENFIKSHPDFDIRVNTVRNHLGKTNAQDEAVEVAEGEILVFSDANSIFKEDAISELVSYFTSDDIEYVCGSLIYKEDETASVVAENTYWNMELTMRKIESNIKTIAAGNGAIYACRKKDYRNYDLVSSHDYEMPLHAGLNGKRALYNEDALAFEKAGSTTSDEFKRKVRMQRRILTNIRTNLRRLNIFKYGWFSFFHFNHKTLRFLQAFFHIVLFISNIFLIRQGFIYKLILLGQVAFLILAILGQVSKAKNKIVYFPRYYSMMMLAQILGAKNELTGKSKATWEKAESTR